MLNLNLPISTFMKTYLVPIDFSDAANNAAHFAAELSKQTDVQDIILMNAYYISVYETMFPDPNMMMLRDQEIEENATERIAQLEKLKRKLQKQVRPGVKLHVRLNRTHLLRAVVDTVAIDNVDLLYWAVRATAAVRKQILAAM